MAVRARLTSILFTAALVWGGATTALETYRGWRALPPHFERIPGTLRWHDREARRLRLFVDAASTTLPPDAGCWAWQSPPGSAMRRGELFQWASFLAPMHDLILDDPERRCPWRVVYSGLDDAPPMSGARIRLRHRFGVVLEE